MSHRTPSKVTCLPSAKGVGHLKWSSKQTHCHRACTGRSQAATGSLGDAASSCSFSVGHKWHGLKTKGSWFPSSGFAGEDQVRVCTIKIRALGARKRSPAHQPAFPIHLRYLPFCISVAIKIPLPACNSLY